MTISEDDFKEKVTSQLPFVELLINLGYTYLSKEKVQQERGGDTRKFILKNVAAEALMRINSYEHKGKKYKFSTKDVLAAIDELENLPLEGLVDTSAEVYKLIMPKSGGKTISVVHEGKSQSKNFRFIDFEKVENNDFHVTVEFVADGKEQIRADIVVFVNGIPFAVVENKRSGLEVEKALLQLNSYQSKEKCPKFFIYPQLLVGTNGNELRYGTTGTPNEFYANWREKGQEEALEQNTLKLIGQKIDEEVYQQLLKDLSFAGSNYSQKTERGVSPQDRSVVALFAKARLLDLTKNFILYDGGIKKVMRYQQFFAIKKIQERIAQDKPKSGGAQREGGIVWHTQGTGKSLTMVMFVRALIEDPTIKHPRILVVTDRRDLDDQIRETFKNAGLKKDVKKARSKKHLLKMIKDKELAVITTLVHKFANASKQAEFVDKDKNIFVLIDEAHRSHGGGNSLDMSRVIPNACFIAFTGTPLLKDDKSYQRFGAFIDKYTIDDALEDGIVLPLVYEGRYVELKQNQEKIDRLYEGLLDSFDEKQREQAKKSNLEKKIIAENPHRIVEIAYDIERHYLENFKGHGLKAQLVAPSKYAAVLFQKIFKESGQLNTAVVISDENGAIHRWDQHRKYVETYLRRLKGDYQSLKSYEERVIESFKEDEGGVEVLIVVDKLLTGFDAPRNTVLYLARELRDHNLLQAIARVNRLYDNPTLPKTAGYVIDYSQNAQNIRSAMELFGNYQAEDVRSALIDLDKKIEELEQAYGQLNDLFKGFSEDGEKYLEHLSNEQRRRQFRDRMRKFILRFSECSGLNQFSKQFKQLDLYRKDLKKFMKLREVADVKYAERADFTKYKIALTQVLDESISAQEAETLTRQIAITNGKAFWEVIEKLDSDKSKAEAIANQTEKEISENAYKDPEFYAKFSEKIKDLLEKMRQNRIEDIQALKKAKQINEVVLSKKDDSVPERFSQKEGADIIYRNLRKEFEEVDIDAEQFEEVAMRIYEIIKENSVVDWWKNAEHKRQMRELIDDYLYDTVRMEMGITLSQAKMDEIISLAIEIAQNNHDIFHL